MKCVLFRHELHAIRMEMAEVRDGEVRLVAENYVIRVEMAEMKAENDAMG